MNLRMAYYGSEVHCNPPDGVASAVLVATLAVTYPSYGSRERHAITVAKPNWRTGQFYTFAEWGSVREENRSPKSPNRRWLGEVHTIS